MTMKVNRPKPLHLLNTGFRKVSACMPLTSSSIERLTAGSALVLQQVDGSSLARISTELSERWDIYRVMKEAHTAFVKRLMTIYDIWYVRFHSLLQQYLGFLYTVYFISNFIIKAALSSESTIQKSL